MLYNIKYLYLHCVFHGIRFKVNNEDWLSVRIAFFFTLKNIDKYLRNNSYFCLINILMVKSKIW
ncbi:MAG: hypothetical protein E7085_09875 [Parabacteroides distasonis]|nr:hypothetical protein [Parabacteroides distasonis]